MQRKLALPLAGWSTHSSCKERGLFPSRKSPRFSRLRINPIFAYYLPQNYSISTAPLIHLHECYLTPRVLYSSRNLFLFQNCNVALSFTPCEAQSLEHTHMHHQTDFKSIVWLWIGQALMNTRSYLLAYHLLEHEEYKHGIDPKSIFSMYKMHPCLQVDSCHGISRPVLIMLIRFLQQWLSPTNSNTNLSLAFLPGWQVYLTWNKSINKFTRLTIIDLKLMLAIIA